MALPQVVEARLFYRAAKLRLEDAKYLLDGGRTNGAVYLAGYAVECMLKALLLDRAPPKRRMELKNEMRGGRAHDFGWLKEQYRQSAALDRPHPLPPRRDSPRICAWCRVPARAPVPRSTLRLPLPPHPCL